MAASDILRLRKHVYFETQNIGIPRMQHRARAVSLASSPVFYLTVLETISVQRLPCSCPTLYELLFL